MLILSLPLLELGSKSTSLSPGLCVRRPRQYDSITSLSPGLCVRRPRQYDSITSLSPGLSVRRPRQYDSICWELNLISGFFAFFWLSVWADGINKCGWFLQEEGDVDPRSLVWVKISNIDFALFH